MVKCQGQDSALGTLPSIYLESKEDAEPHTILEAAWMPKGWKLKVAGIETVQQVDALRGKPILAKIKDLPSLPENEFYIGEIIGATAVDETGKNIGSFLGVESIQVAGGADRWWFKIENEEVAVPAVQRFIAGVDAQEKKIRLKNLHELLG